MVDMTAIAGAMSSLKAMKDIAEAMIGLRDAKAFQSKRVELYSLIISTQSAVFAVNEERAALVEEVSEFKKKVADLEAWETEKQRYELKRVSSFGSFAYSVKEAVAGSEPPHYICAACYERGKKSILQGTPALEVRRRMFLCPECKTTIAIEL